MMGSQEDKMLQHCTVCGGSLTPHLLEVRDPLTKKSFSIKRCSGCGLGHTVPQPQNMSPYYALQYYGNRHGVTLEHCIRRRLRFVASAVRPKTGKRLLDIGCGDGSFLLAAREKGWDVMGTELDSQPARSVGLDVRESIDEIPLTEPFDCITMWHTLEHVRDVESTLMQTAKLLKPNGKMIISVPDNGGLQAKIFRGQWLHMDVPRHLYHFEASSLNFCLQSAGFAIERQWHQEFEYDLLGWSQSALNCIMPDPNVFFDFLTGKQKKHSKSIVLVNIVLGSFLTLLSLPAVVAGTLWGRGGTLIVMARVGR